MSASEPQALHTNRSIPDLHELLVNLYSGIAQFEPLLKAEVRPVNDFTRDQHWYAWTSQGRLPQNGLKSAFIGQIGRTDSKIQG